MLPPVTAMGLKQQQKHGGGTKHMQLAQTLAEKSLQAEGACFLHHACFYH